MDRSRLEICQVLLSVGADPLEEHPTMGYITCFVVLRLELTRHSNCHDFALQKSLQINNPASAHLWNALFRSDDAIERLNLTVLHQTILGLNNLNLEDLIKSVPSARVDEVDVIGRSALFWAAGRGDVLGTSLLIRAHANVNSKTHRGNRPLDAAFLSRNEICIWLILNANNVDCKYRSHAGLTPLHYCCVYGSSITILEKLISLGVDLEQLTGLGATALHYAVQEGHEHLARYLILHGANANAITHHGENGLSLALEHHRHRILQLLLAKEADYRQTIHVDETLLHYAAKHADIKSLQILCAFDLSGIDVRAITTGFEDYADNQKIKGRAALDIAMQREDIGQEWLELFERLVKNIEFPDVTDVFEDQVEGSEVFEDAVEQQI